MAYSKIFNLQNPPDKGRFFWYAFAVDLDTEGIWEIQLVLNGQTKGKATFTVTRT